jgi:hypothetical protein
MRYAHLAPDAFREDFGRLGESLADPGKVHSMTIGAR